MPRISITPARPTQNTRLRAKTARIAALVTIFGAAAMAFSACTTAADQPVQVSARATETTEPAPRRDTALNHCEGLTATVDGQLKDAQLNETSGLAVSLTQTVETQPLLWLHNDSGSAPAVFATSPDGTNLGKFELTQATNGVSAADLESSDVEDIAIFNGQIYLADIGDNNSQRTTIRIYAFAEPSPAARSGPGEFVIEEASVTVLSYPDGARDAEAFVIDPRTGELTIITKAFGLNLGLGSSDPSTNSGVESAFGATTATIYSTPLSSLGSDRVVKLEEAGKVDAPALQQRAAQRPADGRPRTFGLDGVITGADITADGQLVALRTYGSVWLFGRGPGQSLAEALSTSGCEAPVVPEGLGEAVGFVPISASQLGVAQTIAFFTVGEGVNAPIHKTS